MENFKYVFRMQGITITDIMELNKGLMIETEIISIHLSVIKDIELIKGENNHVYKLESIEADTINNKRRLGFWYIDLNEVKVNRI